MRACAQVAAALVVAALAALLYAASPAQEREPSAVLFHNCHFWRSGRDEGERFDALLVSLHGRVLWSGDHATASKTRFRYSEVDLGGRHCLPGLVDTHAHMIMGGAFLSALDLSGVASKAEFVRRVAAAAEDLSEGEWLMGGGWDENKFADRSQGLPRAEWVDEVTASNPVFLSRSDGHMVLVNDVALALAQVDASTPDPEGGVIERDEGGRPTGLLKDTAIALVRAVQPVPTFEQKEDHIKRAAAYALSNGVTMVHDMGIPTFTGQSLDLCMKDLSVVYWNLAQRSELSTRVYACVPLDAAEELRAFIDEKGGWSHQSEMLSFGCVKDFYDGSLGSETALFHDPYASDAANTGIRIHDRDRLERSVRTAIRSDLQVILHAIGDKAVDEASEIIVRAAEKEAAAAAERGRERERRPQRHRLEHVQHVKGKETLERLASANIVASVNPLHLLDDADMMLEKLGEMRSGAGRSYAFKSMLESNVSVVFGSDWPLVAPLDPLGSIMAATDRVPPGHKGKAFVSEERITREQALAAVTGAASHASFTENLAGSLSEGARADFVVLDRDILTCTQRPAVLRVYINGKAVFEGGGEEEECC